MNIYEVVEKGEIVQLVCFGHVNDVEFREECFKDFQMKPIRILKKWQRDRIKIYETNRGKKKLKIFSEICESTDQDSIPITIGMFE